MNQDEHLISKFYTAFDHLDAKTMQQCYSDHITFYDPVFGRLQGEEVYYMWEMLCKNAQNFSVKYSDIKNLGEGYYSCIWEAHYTFGKAKRKVHNKIMANLKINQGKITEHTDTFDLYRWCGQAFGFIGWLLGYTTFFQNKVHRTARKGLADYMLSQRKLP